MTIRLYTKDGTDDGGHWKSPRPISDLDNDLRAAVPGDSFLIGFDRMREDPLFWSETTVHVPGGGEENDPLRIAFGFIGSADTVVAPTDRSSLPMIRQSGAPFYQLIDPDLSGPPFMVLGRNASHIRISGPVFSHCPANGFIRFDAGDGGATLTGVHISDIHATMAGRVLESADGMKLQGCVIEQCSATGIVRGFARFKSLSDSVLRSLNLDAALVDGVGTDVCQLISVIKGSNIRFESIRLANAVSARNAEVRGSSYIQGDGIVCEREVSNVEIVDCHARNFGDGGFDLKADGIRLVGSSAMFCKYGVRVWSANPANAIDECAIVSMRSRSRNEGACVWCGGRITITDSLLRSTGGPDVIHFGKSFADVHPTATIRGGHIEFSEGSKLAGGEPGTLIFDGVSVNGEIITGKGYWDGDRLDWSK